jgi:hypothetical protein
MLRFGSTDDVEELSDEAVCADFNATRSPCQDGVYRRGPRMVSKA